MPPKQTLITTAEAPPSYNQSYLNRSLFDQAIEQHGYQCYIERACKCPCKSMNSGAVLSDCLNCAGTGWFWINRQKTNLLCSSMANRNKYEAWTAENAGTVSISCKAEDKLGYMDKVTILELESWFSEVKNIRISSTNVPFVFTTYEPLRVFELYMFESSDVPLKLLLPDIHYTIEKNKIVFTPWVVGGTEEEPEYIDLENKTITLRYVHAPVYFVIDINRDMVRQKQMVNCAPSADLKTNFPLNCVARRMHYIIEPVDFTGELLFDNTAYDKTPPNYDF